MMLIINVGVIMRYALWLPDVSHVSIIGTSMSSKLVLVLNCGSSSLKFAIIDAVNGEEYLSGLAECFHLPEARIKWKMDGNKREAALGAGAAHHEALVIVHALWHKNQNCLRS
ncbi:hypothetical protein ACLK2I_12695 [Escherichia coli]